MLSQTELEKFFKRFSLARRRLPKGKGNLFEVYVFLLACEQANRVGFNVDLRFSGSIFVFRASPGPVGGGFGYAQLLSNSGKSYELHTGVEIAGHSTMDHEADVVLLQAGAPNSALSPFERATGYAVRLAIECKLYSDASRLKGEVRKIVGAVLDWSNAAHPSKNSGQPQGCLHCGVDLDAAFVTNVPCGRRPDIEGYLETYDVVPCFGVVKGSNGLARFDKYLSSVFGKLI
jgi:hypothetical protein